MIQSVKQVNHVIVLVSIPVKGFTGNMNSNNDITTNVNNIDGANINEHSNNNNNPPALALAGGTRLWEGIWQILQASHPQTSSLKLAGL